MLLLLEVSARAVLIAAGVAVTLLALRIRSPRLAHRAWVGAAIALIALPALVTWGPAVSIPVAAGAPAWAAGGTHEAAPAAATAVHISPIVDRSRAPATAMPWGRWFGGVYLLGAAVLFTRLFVGLRLGAMLKREATLVRGRLTSRRCATPVTVGLLAPVVILPRDWTAWPPSELAAVLAHEEEHVRCRDPLAAALTLVARALFWFHPLAWWLSRRVAHLSERACDVAVLARGHDADAYAASLVKFARAQAHAGRRIAAPGIAMGGLALEHRLRLLQHPVLASTGSARLLAAVTAYALAVGLCCTAAPVAAMPGAPGPPPQPSQPSASQPRAGAWRAATTEHFEIYAPDEQAHLVAEVARQAEEAYAELSAAFRYELRERVSVALVGGDIQLRDATVTVSALDGPPISLDCEFTMKDQTMSGGCVAPGQAGRQVILVPVAALDTQRRFLVHELTHSFAFDVLPEPSRVAPWLIEGLAEHHRGMWNADSVRSVRSAVASRRIPGIEALAGAERYWSQALFDFIADSHGAEGLRRCLAALRTRPRVADAVPAALGTTAAQLDAAFRRYVSGRFGTL